MAPLPHALQSAPTLQTPLHQVGKLLLLGAVISGEPLWHEVEGPLLDGLMKLLLKMPAPTRRSVPICGAPA